ncbi:MAG TPA: hypothetical protein VI564_04195 [Candidatus Nanoarchaeia archaeon]|nr:hypothetical protein [Candidatus Nanoarchaeia archaeon]
MRTGLLSLGVVLLVLGAVFYYFPIASASASGSQLEAGKTRTVIGYASLPMQVSIASMIIGAILIVLGLALPGSQPNVYVETPERRVEHHTEKIVERRRART